MQDKRNAAGLSYYREGQHDLMLRETDETFELVEVFHGYMNIEARLRGLQQFPVEDQA